jgi:pantetheine-phosphate adenylyltransferase
MANCKISAVFPGSLDPLHFGHCDIVRRSLRIFPKVIVGILHNTSKPYLFAPEERVALIKEEFKEYGKRVEVYSFRGLLVEFVRKVNAQVIIRGLRAVSDYDYEAQMAIMNRNLAEELETFFLVTREVNAYLSSSIVKQVAMMGGNVSKLVPKHIAKALKEKYQLSMKK